MFFILCFVFQVQRDQIWRALFGDTPLQSITSPFMLSPPETSDSVRSSNWNTPRNDSNWNTPNYTTNGPHSSLSFDSTSSGERQTTSLSPRARAPPKVGFIPRGTNSYHLREDIRRIRLSSAYSESSFTTDDSLTETDVVRSNGSAALFQLMLTKFHFQIPPAKMKVTGWGSLKTNLMVVTSWATTTFVPRHPATCPAKTQPIRQLATAILSLTPFVLKQNFRF